VNTREKRSDGRLVTVGLPVLLILLSLGLYLPTISKDEVVNDSQAAAASAWRIATTGSPWMEEVDTARLEGHTDPDIWIVDTEHGHRAHNRTAGVILAGVPFYWALNNDPDPAAFRIWVGGVAAACITAAAGVFMFLGLRSRFGDGAAFAGTAALLFTTPVWSVSADALWTQNVTILAIAGATWALAGARWVVAGAFFALGILARPHLAVIAAVVGLYLGWRRRDWRIVLGMGASSALGLVMLTMWNRAVFGFWSLRGGYSYDVRGVVLGESGTVSHQVANVLGFLVWPSRGLLVWTPVILLLLPSMLAAWKQLPDWVRALVLGGVVYSVIQLRISPFHGGLGLYGYRVALELLVCLVPALLYAYKQTAAVTRYFIGGLLGLQFAAIAIGASTLPKYLFDEENHAAVNAFVVSLADRPLAYGIFTAVCALVGILVTGFAMRRTSREQQLAAAAAIQ
jgi:hypothetical protein